MYIWMKESENYHSSHSWGRFKAFHFPRCHLLAHIIWQIQYQVFILGHWNQFSTIAALIKLNFIRTNYLFIINYVFCEASRIAIQIKNNKLKCFSLRLGHNKHEDLLDTHANHNSRILPSNWRWTMQKELKFIIELKYWNSFSKWKLRKNDFKL